jgi:DNA-binding NarL/FixJ family response regulator
MPYVIDLMKIRLALADDHRLMRDGLKAAIQGSENCEVKMEAENGEQLLQLLRACDPMDLPEVVLLDVQMPVLDGILTAERMNAEFPSMKVLVVSMHTDEKIVLAMLKRGVHGYINKNVSRDELLEAIREVFIGNRYFSSLVVNVAMNYLSGHSESGSQKLSPREMDLLRWIFQEKTSEDIATEMMVSKRTVDTMIASIMSKLQVNSRVGIVLAAMRNNLVNLQGEPVS